MKTKVLLSPLALVCAAVCGCAGFLPKEGYLFGYFEKENKFFFEFDDEVATKHGGIAGEGIKNLVHIEIQKRGVCPKGYSLKGPYAYKGRNHYSGECNSD